MVFSSLTFLFLFFPLVMGVYYLCPRALRNLWLLLTSLLFYAWGEPVYIRLMVASILFNYLCGLGVAALQKREKKRLAKGLLILCIAGNIGALGLFKYADLLIGTVNNIAGSKIALLELALPIGISFYTFQALSYVIDVYRGTVAAQKNPITFGTYIALFPQLIAGPRWAPCGIPWRRCRGQVFPPGRPGWEPSPLPSRFTLTFPAIPIWPSGWEKCWALSSWKTSIILI